MKIIDSNLVIYAAKTEFAFLRPSILEVDLCVSIITKLEAMGYRNLTADDKTYLEDVFRTIIGCAIDDAVIDRAILLRQLK